MRLSLGVRGVRRPTRKMGSQQPRAEPNSQSLCGKHDTSPTGRTRSTLTTRRHDNPTPMKIFSTHAVLRTQVNTNQRHYTCTQLYSADCPVRKAPRARLRTAPPPQSHTASVSHRLSLAPPQSHTPHTPHPAGIPHPHAYQDSCDLPAGSKNCHTPPRGHDQFQILHTLARQHSRHRPTAALVPLVGQQVLGVDVLRVEDDELAVAHV